MKLRIHFVMVFLILLFVLFLISSCSSRELVAETVLVEPSPSAVESSPTPQPTQTEILPTATPTLTPEPSLTSTITNTPIPLCYREVFPPAYQNSAVIDGFKLFTKENDLTLRFIYFPQNCSEENVQKDIEFLFYHDSIRDDELALFILDEWYSGILGDLHQHLMMYDFWAMGPEDYPLFFGSEVVKETNIIIWRADRVNGEGTEGNAILSLMIGMAEHEYIHTVQGRNNPKLAEMIWQDGVFQAFIERYANLGNNSGHRYRQASLTMMELLQFLDGLNSQSLLTSKVDELLKNQNQNAATFFDREFLVYDKNLSLQIQMATGDKYLETLKNGKVNPFLLLSLAGSGNLEVYKLLQDLYDENIAQYNQWFYSNNTKEYLPASFDELFNPN